MARAKNEILHLQKVALFEAYNKIRKEYKDKATLYPRYWLVHKTLNCQAPRTYLSYEEAQRIISKKINGTYTPSKFSTIEDRNANLYKTYKRLYSELDAIDKKIHPKHLKAILVERALYEPTPRFYMAERLATDTINQFTKNPPKKEVGR